MENSVRDVKDFLKSKGLEWDGLIVIEGEVREAVALAQDEFFDNETLFNIKLSNGKVVAEKAVLVTDRLFIVLDKERTKKEADFSNEWINFRAKTPEAKERMNKKLREIYRSSKTDSTKKDVTENIDIESEIED